MKWGTRITSYNVCYTKLLREGIGLGEGRQQAGHPMAIGIGLDHGHQLGAGGAATQDMQVMTQGGQIQAVV